MKRAKKVIHHARKHWKRYIIIALVVLVLGFIVIRKSTAQTQEITTGYAQIKDLKKTLDVSGIVDAHAKAYLRFLAGGKVTYIGAKEGDTVKKWQTIAAIDTRSLQKSLQQGLNTFDSSRMDNEQTYEDNKDIYGDKAVERDLVQSNMSLRNTALSVEITDLAIKNSSLVSPLDGILYSSPTNISGVILTATDAFRVADPKTLFFQIDVDEADIGLVKVGQSVDIVLDAYADEHIESTVESISYQSTMGTSGTTYAVKVNLPVSTDIYKYKLGMNGTAHILLEKKEQVLSVPITAITQRDGKTYVQVMNALKKPEQKEISTGIETDEDIEVLSGISSSDEIVIQ